MLEFVDTYLKKPNFYFFQFQYTDAHYVQKIINNLKLNLAQGPRTFPQSIIMHWYISTPTNTGESHTSVPKRWQ